MVVASGQSTTTVKIQAAPEPSRRRVPGDFGVTGGRAIRGCRTVPRAEHWRVLRGFALGVIRPNAKAKSAPISVGNKILKIKTKTRTEYYCISLSTGCSPNRLQTPLRWSGKINPNQDCNRTRPVCSECYRTSWLVLATDGVDDFEAPARLMRVMVEAAAERMVCSNISSAPVVTPW